MMPDYEWMVNTIDIKAFVAIRWTGRLVRKRREIDVIVQ